MIKKGILSVIAISCLAISAYAADKVITPESLSLRKTNIVDESKAAPVDAKFDAAAPGAAKTIERSYQNAPPLIPHSVDGLLPIKKDSNQCLGCHMPDVAKGVGATPIPASHFTDFRPATKLGKDGKVIKDGKAVVNTTDITIAKYKSMKKLNPARFNCSQCHVPQANIKPLVENTFKPEFNDKKLKSSSNLLDVINKGVK